MSSHLIDSRLFGRSWGTDEMRQLFDERSRTQRWLDVLVALAEAQAETGLIPGRPLAEIRRVCRVDRLDFDRIREGYEETGHSFQGLLSEIARHCEDAAADWICYGATVQDITDTWLAGALLEVWALSVRDLRCLEETLLETAREHRSTVMLGRTHGQSGLPITFGFKVAVWASEIRRHLERLREARSRLGFCQLGGGVGALHPFGDRAFELQRRFARRLGLIAPTISWISARDSLVEFIQLLSLIAGSLDKIGHEIYNLQRSEIGELREAASPDNVGSITMPHKRNPEVAEHLGTLARLIRHHAASLAESQVHDHERDGRSWKLEWAVVPTACMLAGAALAQARQLLDGLEVDPERMRQNLRATRGSIFSETVMLALAQKAGRLQAHDIVRRAARQVAAGSQSLRSVLAEDPDVKRHLSAAELDDLFALDLNTGRCRALVDRVLEAAADAQRASEP